MNKKIWNDKPYHSLDYYLKNRYGRKIYKIALNPGFSCPNRDGVLGTGGCIFCSKGGSGDFAIKESPEFPDIPSQLKEGIRRISDKAGDDAGFIAYFQAYTNTYAPVNKLREVYEAALKIENCVGISIATRPDCLSFDVMKLLEELLDLYPEKFIWVELGLQTIHKKTSDYIRRGYELYVFEDAIRKLHSLSIPIIVHVILGLPGETKAEMLQTIEYLNTFPIFGIKLQLLHVLKETDLAIDYYDNRFETLSQLEYTDIIINSLELLCPDIVIHRLTGDGPKNLLISPMWSTDKKNVLNTILKEMKNRDSWQGKRYENSAIFNVI